MAQGEPIRRRVFDIIEQVDREAFLPKLVSGGLVALILINVVAGVTETVPDLLARYRWLFRAIEAVSLIVFTLEYATRLWVAVEHPRALGLAPWRARLVYAMTPAAIVDFIAIVPFFVEIFTDTHLRVIVLLRLLRLFKLGRYSTGFQSLLEAVRRERDALLATFLILVSVVLISASFEYMAEHEAQPNVFGSIPDSIWWALTTATTVGYGDVIPQTVLGRLVAGATMISGILMIALPVAIIGSSFAEVVRHRSFVITFGMIARVPLFNGLNHTLLSEILPLLKAVAIGQGVQITDGGGSAESIYLIAEGVVAVDYPRGRRKLVAGEVFGMPSNLAAGGPRYPAMAVTRVRLLVLDRMELVHLVARHPELALHFSPDASTTG